MSNLTIKVGNVERIDKSIATLAEIKEGVSGFPLPLHHQVCLTDMIGILQALKRAANDPAARTKKESETTEALWDVLERIIGTPPQEDQTLLNYAKNAETVTEILYEQAERQREWQHKHDLDSIKNWNARVSAVQNELTATLGAEKAEWMQRHDRMVAQRDHLVRLLGSGTPDIIRDHLVRMGTEGHADVALKMLDTWPTPPGAPQDKPKLDAMRKLMSLRPLARELKHQRVTEEEYNALDVDVRAFFTLEGSAEAHEAAKIAGNKPVNYPLDGIEPVSREEYLKRHPEHAHMLPPFTSTIGGGDGKNKSQIVCITSDAHAMQVFGQPALPAGAVPDYTKIPWTWSAPKDENDTVRGSTEDGWATTVQWVVNKGWHATVTQYGRVVLGTPCITRGEGMMLACQVREKECAKANEEPVGVSPEVEDMLTKLTESCGPRLHGEHVKEPATKPETMDEREDRLERQHIRDDNEARRRAEESV